jgi:hypothetical protein
MNTHQQRAARTLPVANYSPAIAKALEWLGERYLLARPVQAARAPAAPATVHSLPILARRRAATPATIHYARRT